MQCILINPMQFIFKEYGELMFGGLTGYSLVLVHHIGTGKLLQIKRFGGLTKIHCMNTLIPGPAAAVHTNQHNKWTR